MAHAKLSASGAHRWINCPGSVKAEEGRPDSSSVFAGEGTRAHELAEMALSSGKDAADWIGQTVHGDVIDADMASHVQSYIDYVLSFKGRGWKLLIEQRVPFDEFVDGGFGTLDAAVYSTKKAEVHIFDLKYGKGVPVFAENNQQAQMYALGLYQEMDLLHDLKTFTVHICQPRLKLFTSWTFEVDQLLAFADEVKAAAALALSDNAPRIASEKACQWCKAKGDCPALFAYASEIIATDFEDLSLSHAERLDNNQLAMILDHKKLIVEFLAAVEHEVFVKVCAGEDVSGYKIVEGRSNRVWTDQAEGKLVELLGDDAYNKKLIGVTEAEKRVTKAVVNDLTKKPAGSPTLVPASDKRPAMLSVVDSFDNLE